MGDPGEARRHWAEALAVFAGINERDADQVRAALAALDDAVT